MDLWEAFYRIEPWGNEYQRHAVEMELAEALFAFQVNSNLPKNRPDLKYKPRTQQSFFPADYEGNEKPQKAKKPNIVEQCQQFARMVTRRDK